MPALKTLSLFAAFALLAILPAFAFAAGPSAAVLSRIEGSFNPAMTATETPAGRSLSLCATTSLKLSVEDPVSKVPGFVQAMIYEPHHDTDLAVLVLPPTGGENILDQGYANALCSSGFRAVVIQHWYNDTAAKLDLSMHDEGALRSLAAIRHVVDYLKPSRPNQVGILGTSVGAISSELAMGFDPRLNNAVLVVGGIGMPEIIAASSEKTLTALRTERMKAFGYKSPDEYLAALRAAVVIEPADFAEFSGHKNVLAFVGTQDVTVPTVHQRELVKLYGAENYEYAGDHQATIIHTFTSDRSKVVGFFEKNLK
ncbi:MAG: alpha/beta hydrolase family protein [Bdellovibrionota bacterium]